MPGSKEHEAHRRYKEANRNYRQDHYHCACNIGRTEAPRFDFLLVQVSVRPTEFL
jgi:hypothetical protein